MLKQLWIIISNTFLDLMLFRQQMAAEDQEMVDALINDVTSGALRKRQNARDGIGKGLDIYDSDDEAEAMLRRIQSQMGMTSKKKTDIEESSLATLGRI